MVDNAAVNTGVQMSFCISVLVFLRQKPRGGVELSEASQKEKGKYQLLLFMRRM